MKRTKRTKRKIAVLLLISLIVPYMGVSGPDKAGYNIPAAKAETISEETEWNIKYMNAEKSYEESKNLKRIKVAVLDSGLDYDSDIPFVERKDFLGEQELHPLYQDKTGHGTSVAGLICARKSDDRITGIAANVDLYAGRILDADNKAPIDRVIEGIRWAMENKVDIIHMSYGTQDYDEELEEVINQAYGQGILLVASAGNSGTAAEDESTVEYPAAFDNVISVGATNADNKKTETSSSGYELDVVAPGDQILSSGAFGGVVVEEGTTVSAAQVTGLAAVLWGKYPDASNEFIKGLLVSGANAEAVDENCGKGIVDYEQSKQNYEKMNATYKVFKHRGATEKLAVEKAEESVGENRKEIREAGDVKYVNGAWGKDVHEGFIDNVDNINIVRKGAVYPDEVDSMKGMKDHPYFHGKGNYLSNTQYLFMLAQSYIRMKDNIPECAAITTERTYGQYTPLKLGIKKGYGIETKVGKVLPDLWKKYEEEHININTNREKGYALLGVAIHNATDAMSHRASINLGQYGGWQRVVHKEEMLSDDKKDDCADHWFTTWAKEGQEPLKTVAKQWKKLSIADDPKVLKPFLEVSGDIAKYLIQYIKEGKERCYDCFSISIERYWKGKPDKSLRLENLNENWKVVTSKEKKFGVSVKISKQKVEAIDEKNVMITKHKKAMRVTIMRSSPNLYYRLSRGTKTLKYYKSMGGGKGTYWIIPNSLGKINIQTCSIHGSKERNGIATGCTIYFSRKNIKGATGTIKRKKTKPGKTYTLPKKGFKKKGWKIKKWYRLVQGNPIYFKCGKQICRIKEDVTFYPYFVKKKKAGKK